MQSLWWAEGSHLGSISLGGQQTCWITHRLVYGSKKKDCYCIEMEQALGVSCRFTGTNHNLTPVHTGTGILGNVITTNKHERNHLIKAATHLPQSLCRVSLHRPDLRRTFDFQNSSSPEVTKLKEKRPERKQSRARLLDC